MHPTAAVSEAGNWAGGCVLSAYRDFTPPTPTRVCDSVMMPASKLSEGATQEPSITKVSRNVRLFYHAVFRTFAYVKIQHWPIIGHSCTAVTLHDTVKCTRAIFKYQNWICSRDVDLIGSDRVPCRGANRPSCWLMKGGLVHRPTRRLESSPFLGSGSVWCHGVGSAKFSPPDIFPDPDPRAQDPTPGRWWRRRMEGTCP